MFLPEISNNLRPGSSIVAQDTPANPAAEFCNQLGWEPTGVSAKRFGDNDTGHFPVAGDGVFAFGCLGHAPVTTLWLLQGGEAADLNDIGQSQPFHYRQSQSPYGKGYMAQGIAALIAILMGIRQSANANAVQYNKQYSHIDPPMPYFFARG